MSAFSYAQLVFCVDHMSLDEQQGHEGATADGRDQETLVRGYFFFG